MPLSRETIQQNALDFSERWKDEEKWNEKSFGQSFVRDFLAVFGVDAIDTGTYEKRSGGGFADYLLPKKIAIEMKSKGKDLNDAYRQLAEYVLPLPVDEIPDLLMVSDFENIILYYRTEITKKKPKSIAFKINELIDHIDRFHVLAGLEKHHTTLKQDDVNVQAANMMADLHDDLKRHGYKGHDLEIYLVRLLFCLFAEDTGIFPKDYFLSYIKNSQDLSGRIGKLFEVLNMPEAEREKHTLLSDDLKKFRFINGGLFEKLLPTADFDEKMRQTLIRCCTFDWSKISPAIFGSMFQGVMNKGKRREIGAHYTSEENILKVIDPLFMDDLRAELNRVKASPKRLEEFHEKIARLKFLDPACGCGNFLMIAYQQLRFLEIDIVRIKKRRETKGQKVLDITIELKVSVEQFFGIEIEDFPCEVARVGMWLMDHLMNILASKELGQYYERLPLTKDGATIIHGNANRIDWESIVPKKELSYIFGNPPFRGKREQSFEQKADMKQVFAEHKHFNTMDYVSAWYMNAAKYVQNTDIRCGFVSTNSITQGEQVAFLWKPLLECYKLNINFAYKTFKWTNEAPDKAAVHCVIIGFSCTDNNSEKRIFDVDGSYTIASNISPYMVDSEPIIIQKRTKPLCSVPPMDFGNMPNDGGLLCKYTDKQKRDLVREYPSLRPYFKRFCNADVFLYGIDRWCIWLQGVSPKNIAKEPFLKQVIRQVKELRNKSSRQETQRLSALPYLFGEIRQPKTKYIAIPRISSERRTYIPMGFMRPDVIVSDAIQIIPGASLYHFGILSSQVHMTWVRQVCGRLEMRFNYSSSIVYNNFPWPEASEEQKAVIEKLAKNVLDVRAKFPESSLADLYDPLTMPKELLKAHQTLDQAVMKLYGFKKEMDESAIVAALLERYHQLTTPPMLIGEVPNNKRSRKKQL